MFASKTKNCLNYLICLKCRFAQEILYEYQFALYLFQKCWDILFRNIQLSCSDTFWYFLQNILVSCSEYFAILSRNIWVGRQGQGWLADWASQRLRFYLFVLCSFNMLPEYFERKKNNFKKIQSVNILACRLKPGSRTGEQSGGKEFGFTSGGLSWCWRMLIIIHDNDTQELYDVAL